jgi:NADPH-dependent ferric siderophore reductase
VGDQTYQPESKEEPMQAEPIPTRALNRDDLERFAEDADHLNDEHRDTVTFVARFAGGWPDTTDAGIASVDENGVEFDLVLENGSSTSRRIDFSTSLVGLEAVRTSLYSLLAVARERATDSVPQTSLELEIAAVADLKTFQTTVSDIVDLTPRLRQITFSGGLDDFTPIAPDQFMLVTPPDAGGRAYYTVRRWRAETGEMDMWFVLHDDHGPISGWVARTHVGAVVSLWGPRTSFEPPADTTSLVLVADDTGLPAVAAILDSTELPARVILETYDPDHLVDLEGQADWLFRGEDLPGTGGRLPASIEALDFEATGTYFFGAGESREMTAIRKHLRQGRGLPREQVQMTAYWRRT